MEKIWFSQFIDMMRDTPSTVEYWPKYIFY